MKLTHIDLFSGIGGFSLAARWAGLDTIVFCERDKFCQKVLNKHWPGVPIHDDITTFDGTKYSNVFLLTGGFPCQPFSCAGKRRGKEDDRYLWPEMLRVISEVKPRWIIGENVAGFIDMGLDDCISDLEREGYTVQPFIIPACAINAPHRRDRVWIIGNATGERLGGRCENGIRFKSSLYRQGVKQIKSYCHASNAKSEQTQPTESRGFYSESSSKDSDVADTSNQGLQGGEKAGNIGIDWKEPRNEQFGRCPSWQEPWIEAATRLCGIFNGLSEWMDRVGGLNGKISEGITGQDLPHLWEGFQSESFQWSSGRFNTVQFKENLFTVLWKLFSESNRQDNLPFESKEVQDAFVRNMWISEIPGCPSQRWEYSEQYAREHSDALSQLSYEVALVTKEITEKYSDGRVNRLKALGNAVVPQIPFLIMTGILDLYT